MSGAPGTTSLSRNRTPQAPRFSVEREGAGFAILDFATFRYTLCDPGTSRTQAESLCAAWNQNPALRVHIPKSRKKRGAIRRDYLTFHSEGQDSEDEWHIPGDRVPDDMMERMASELGLTVPDLLADSSVISDAMRRRYADEYEASRRVPATPSTEVAEAVRSSKDWLPPILVSWADEVATQHGYAGARRVDWQATTILSLLDEELLDYRDARASDLYAALDRKLRSPRLTTTAREEWARHFGRHIRKRIGPPSINEQVHNCVIPSGLTWQLFDDGEKACRLLRFLAVHYLSGEIADVKAAAFGLQRRAYLVKVSEARELVAVHIHAIRAVS